MLINVFAFFLRFVPDFGSNFFLGDKNTSNPTWPGKSGGGPSSSGSGHSGGVRRLRSEDCTKKFTKYTWNRNGAPCFGWSLGLVLWDWNSKIEVVEGFQVYITHVGFQLSLLF